MHTRNSTNNSEDFSKIRVHQSEARFVRSFFCFGNGPSVRSCELPWIFRYFRDARDAICNATYEQHSYQDSELRKAPWRPSPCEVHPTSQCQTCRPNIQFSKCLKKTLTQSFWACAQKDVECMGKCWSSRIGCQVWDPGSVIAFVVQHGEKSPLLFSHLLDTQREFPHAIDPQSVHFGCTNGT